MADGRPDLDSPHTSILHRIRCLRPDRIDFGPLFGTNFGTLSWNASYSHNHQHLGPINMAHTPKTTVAVWPWPVSRLARGRILAFCGVFLLTVLVLCSVSLTVNTALLLEKRDPFKALFQPGDMVPIRLDEVSPIVCILEFPTNKFIEVRAIIKSEHCHWAKSVNDSCDGPATRSADGLARAVFRFVRF